MTALIDAYSDWVDQVQLPGTIDQDGATDILQARGPNITDQEGDDWFVAVATMYESHGIIAQATYVQLRNHVNNNAAGAKALFTDLLGGVHLLSETAVISQELERYALQFEYDSIPGILAKIDVRIAAETDPDLVQSDEYGKILYQQRQQELKSALGL